MRLSPVIFSVFALLGALPALAQHLEMPSPRQPLMVIEVGSDKSLKVGAKTVDVDVAIVGRLAETRMTLTFGNPTPRALAGDLYLPLPEHATVSGYALDVDGAMVDGVVVPKDEARRIFEREVRKGVDPGLVEWTKGNVFKTRVFPIPPQGSRTVRVRWVTPLGEDAAGVFYEQPLAFNDPVDFHIKVAVRGAEATPVVSGKGPLALTFDKSFLAEACIKQAPVVQALRVTLPDMARHPAQVERGEDGATWFVIQDTVTAPADATALAVRHLRLYWDASLSRATADHARELALLATLLDRFKDASVELVVIRNRAEAPRLFDAGQGGKVVAFLGALLYDGGTQLAALRAPVGSSSADLQLVFTDGLSTFGADDPGELGAPTWIFSSSLEASHDGLAVLAKKSGGVYYNLLRASRDAALAGVGRAVFSVLSAKVTAGQVEGLLPDGKEPVVGPSFIAGKLLSDAATIEVAFGLPGQPPVVTKTYTIEGKAAGRGDLVSRAWAERALAGLMASPAKNAERITALGRAHGIVTPGTSLLVLERFEQYVEYGVRPPASLPEMRADWDKAMKEKADELQMAVKDRLTEVAELWKTELDWYGQKFSVPAGWRYRDPSASKSDGGIEGHAFGLGGAGRGAAAARSVENEESGAEAPMDKASEADEKGASAKKEAPSEPEPGVELTPWNPDTPYLRALKAAPAEKLLAVYVAQRAEFGTAPSFFLDVSDFFAAKKDPVMALQVLSNVAELRLADPALLRVLGHRLAQLEVFDLAIPAFEEVLTLRPEEPQSFRDLGLVLGRRAPTHSAAEAKQADYARSLALLAEVVRRKWDRFDGIEIMALTEMNRLWPDAQAVGVKTFPLDDRFEKSMALDVRIVMNWDADMTDMDLHVLEPTGEEAYYGHNLTAMGGRVSRDFTQGYGPEVYSIRSALHGKYQVKTKFFGSSAAQLQGAVTLQVDVFTNWGRKNEKRQSMTLRLTENKEDFLVGAITF